MIGYSLQLYSLFLATEGLQAHLILRFFLGLFQYFYGSFVTRTFFVFKYFGP
jgi:hypothetical protein